MRVDEKDVRILRALAEAETGSPDVIHERTGIPTSTVHYRLNRLREKGILSNDLFDVDCDELGFSLTVISEVYAEYKRGYQERIGEKIAQINGVNQVYFVMGDTDFIVISHLSRHEMVEDLITEFEAVDEINRTSSKFVIQTVKSSRSILLDYDERALLDALGIDEANREDGE